jgi:ATP-dependent Clp protease ATP-binding subunit ClpB
MTTDRLHKGEWAADAGSAHAAAGGLAEASHHQEVSAHHLLAALLDQPNGTAGAILFRAGVDPKRLRTAVGEHLLGLPQATPGTGTVIGESFYEAAERAAKERTMDPAGAQGRAEGRVAPISVDHVLLALRGIAGVKREALVEAIDAEREVRWMLQFGEDLTARAREGGMDPVVGRDEEIRRVIQILARRTKNNPVLVGEPGVGKTAIAEGLAQRIATGDVPESLKDKMLFLFDVASVVAGTSHRGEFEERMGRILKTIIAAEGRIITFADELHTLVGAGSAEGSSGAGQLLKPALARGQLPLIGATTLDEYRQFIEKDAALERRFQKVLVEPPSVAETVTILRGLKETYEIHHGVRIQDSALVAAAELSDRYLPSRHLPDKAIDLIDEAASRLRIEIDSLPTALDTVNRRMTQLEIQRMALEKESDQAAAERLIKLDAELETMGAESQTLNAHWRAEKDAITAIQSLKGRLEQERSEAERLSRDGELARSSEITYSVIPQLEVQVEQATEVLAGLQQEHHYLREEVSAEDIGLVLEKATGIPVGRMLEDETQKLLRLETVLHARVIGQDTAVDAVADAIRRSRAGLSSAKRPIGSFLFMGPTGVGKTELAKALAGFLFDDEAAMVRIDMSEYMERHSVSRLVGAAPGYVGYEEGGQLTEAVRRRPYSVILLDEFEKAHADVSNVLLQVLDDGRLTDGQGRTIDFTNTVLIMTSNLAGDPLDRYKPEFINRIDEIVRFHALTEEDLALVFDIQLAGLRSELAEKHLTLEVTPEAAAHLVHAGYDPAFGARPLRRVIQRQIESPLAYALLEGAYPAGATITVDLQDGAIALR